MAERDLRIAGLAERLEDRLVQTRRDLHRNPEPSGKEVRTAGIVADRLHALGLGVQEGVGGHGVIGVLEGSRAGPVVAWRADMDALPMHDELNTSYRSFIPGLSHACGHDAHTAIGLGAAEVLAAMRGELAGTAKFLFQPAEETAQGAKAMLAGGALEEPRPEAIFGLHVSPMAAGQVGLVEGTCLAAISTFSIALHGQEGGDGGAAHVLAADLLHALAGRNRLRRPENAAELDAVLREMETGGAALADFIHLDYLAQHPSVEPQQVTVLGSAFTARDELQQRAAGMIRDILGDLTGPGRVPTDVSLREFVPATINDPYLAQLAGRAAEKVLGAGTVRWLKAPWPFGGEDLAFYLNQIPGALVFLGAASRERGILALPHRPDFDLDEQSLVAGTKVAASILAEFLDPQPHHGRVTQT